MLWISFARSVAPPPSIVRAGCPSPARRPVEPDAEGVFDVVDVGRMSFAISTLLMQSLAQGGAAVVEVIEHHVDGKGVGRCRDGGNVLAPALWWQAA